MGQIVGGAAKPKRCNLNKLSQLVTPAAGEYILVSSDNSMNAEGQGNFDCYIEGDGQKAATALPLHYISDEKNAIDKLYSDLYDVWDVYPDHDGETFATFIQVQGFTGAKHKAIPITGMSTLQIKANSLVRVEFYLAKTYTIPAATGRTDIDFATGETGRRVVAAGTTSAVISIPSDANFLIINSIGSSGNAKPAELIIDGDNVLIGKIEEINEKIGDVVLNEIEQYASVAETNVSGKFINTSLAETENSNYEYSFLSVAEGEKYYVEGWNLNTNIPAAFVAKSGTTNVARVLVDSASKGMSGVVTVPAGYDTLYVNGNLTVGAKPYINKVLIPQDLSEAARILYSYTQLNESLCPLYVSMNEQSSIGEYNGTTIKIVKRFDENNDLVWVFENKMASPNKFFDLRGVGFVPRGVGRIQHFISNTSYTEVVGATTDYIQPLTVGAVNNKNGDFPDNTSLFTGGNHGYNNSGLSTASATMREISREVFLDGIPVELGDRKYGYEIFIKVVSNIQGCNTEKQDGSGREIIQQTTKITINKDGVKLEVSFTALEPIIIYTLYGLAQYFSFTNVQLIGSTSKMGVYTAGEKIVPTDKGTNIIRCFGDNYYFDVEMDRTFALGQNGGMADYNAMGTIANKGYFNLINNNTPLELDTDEQISFKGGFAFGKI